MSDEVIVKSSKNCSLGMHPGTLTLTDQRLTFTTLLKKKVKFDVPLVDIKGVDPFGANLVEIYTADGMRYRVQVNAVTRHEWVETLQQAVAG
jgi:hypothetical protein